jgi:invasion protein IalB
MIEMTRISSVIALLVALTAGAIATANHASAQGVVKQIYGDWQMRCDQPPGARAEQCALVQNVTADDRENVGLSVIVLKTADKKSRLLRVLAPLGVLLPKELGIQIDKNFLGTIPFIRCLANGCYAEVGLEDDPLRQLSDGTTVTFILYQTPEEGFGVPISLRGFKEGFAALP